MQGSKRFSEPLAKALFWLCAAMSILAVALISIYIFAKGLPAIASIGPIRFLFGMRWSPGLEAFGILPMVLTSLLATGIAFVFGSQLGKWTALYLALFCPKRVYRIVKPMIELLAGIPSVVYGFFGAMVFVPFIRENFGGAGKSMLAAIAILTIMILPTIVNLGEASLRAVPRNIFENALALGMDETEAAFQIVLPAASTGLNAAYVMGIGRAIGETMAVILVAGNNPRLPSSLLDPVRTLTTGIALEMGYASGLHQSALFGIGVVLFVFILALNLILLLFLKKK